MPTDYYRIMQLEHVDIRWHESEEQSSKHEQDQDAGIHGEGYFTATTQTRMAEEEMPPSPGSEERAEDNRPEVSEGTGTEGKATMAGSIALAASGPIIDSLKQIQSQNPTVSTAPPTPTASEPQSWQAPLDSAASPASSGRVDACSSPTKILAGLYPGSTSFSRAVRQRLH